MSKALKPVSATKTAETQLEDLMQALPENRLEDLSLQTQAIDMADKAAPVTEAKVEAEVEQSQQRDAQPDTRRRAKAGEEPQATATEAPHVALSPLAETDEAFSEYSKLFIFERHNTQFGVPVKYVVEVVRDFAPIEPLTIMSSTLSSATDQRKGFDVGVDAFIGKPVHVEGVIEKVSAMLERFRGARESIVILQGPETSDQDIAAVLNLQGFRTKRVPTIAAFLRAVQRSTCDLVICEFEPSDGTIVDLFNGLNTSDLPSTPEVIVLLPDTNEANIRMALNAGAKAAVTTGFGVHDLVAKVEKTLADRRTKDEQAQLQRYVSKASLKVALEKAVWGAGQTAPRADRKTVTVTFIDIMNFTPRCEAYAPDDVVEQVNKLFSLVTRAIIKHGGDIDKFIGDACMAFWIHEQNNNAQKALLDTMLKIKACLKALNESDPRLKTDPFALRIGAHSGPAILCDLGAAEARIDLTVIGDTVNTAARLEAAAKLYGLQNLLGESIISAHQDRYCTRMIDRVTVKGKSQSLACFELMDRWDAASDTQKRLAETFNEGFSKYTKADFKAAHSCFEAAQEHEPKGLNASLTPSSLFLKRCQNLMAKPPKTWTGIWDWNA